MQELRWIEQHYGDSTARRSGVPLINHIHEGLRILHHHCASDKTQRAWCLHPLFQADDDLFSNLGLIPHIDPYVMMLVMEYRSVANRGLRRSAGGVKTDFFALSPLVEVNRLLIADKVQNRKDFLKYFPVHDPEWLSLDYYFNMWLKTLNIEPDEYKRLCAVAEDTTRPLA